MHFDALLVFVVLFYMSFILPETRAKGISEISSENSIEYIGNRAKKIERLEDDTEIIEVDQPVVVGQFERNIFSVPRIYRRRRKKIRM